MKTAFIGIDYIIDLVHPVGKMARSAEQVRKRGTIAQANRALQAARARGWLRILVKTGFANGYVDQPKGSPLFGTAHQSDALLLSGHGCDFHPELESEFAEEVVVKPRISAFYGSGLEAALRANAIERVVLAGVSTTWAVHSAARDAHDRDYRVVVAEDACADATEEAHRAAIEQLARIATVTTAGELSDL